MIKDELEQKLRKFLNDNNRKYNSNSIEYEGLRKSGYIDGTIRTFHIVSFTVSLPDFQYDSNKSYFATFDEKDYHIVEIIGPQSYENFEK